LTSIVDAFSLLISLLVQVPGSGFLLVKVTVELLKMPPDRVSCSFKPNESEKLLTFDVPAPANFDESIEEYASRIGASLGLPTFLHDSGFPFRLVGRLIVDLRHLMDFLSFDPQASWRLAEVTLRRGNQMTSATFSPVSSRCLRKPRILLTSGKRGILR
jgi:hypothetical protein